MKKPSTESIQRLGQSLKRLSWYDYGYFAATGYLGSTLIQKANWVQFGAFAIALYFSGQSLYRTHYRKDPYKLEEYCRRAAKKYNAKDYAGAKELASRGIDNGSSLTKEKNLHTAYMLRAQAGIMLGEYEEALEDTTSAIELDETLGAGYYFRSIAKELAGYEFNEYIEDLKRGAELGEENASTRLISFDKERLRYWSNYILESAFNMDKTSESFKEWGYTDADDEESETWHKKFTDVAALAFAAVRGETDKEMAKTPLAVIYSDFIMWILDLRCVDSLQSLRRIAPGIEVDMYDSLVMRLTKTSKLNENWSGYYNTRFTDIYNKRGMGCKTMEEER